MEQKKHLTPEEIAKVYFLYYNAETFHIKFPQTIHAKNSLLKSYLGCSNYVRENFHWFKYRLLLKKLEDISNDDMYQLSKLVTGLSNKTFKLVNVKRSAQNIVYNIAGDLFVGLNFQDGRIKCYDSIVGTLNLDRPFLGEQFLFENNYNMPIYFGVDHWANGKTPIDLGLATRKIDFVDQSWQNWLQDLEGKKNSKEHFDRLIYGTPESHNDKACEALKAYDLQAEIYSKMRSGAAKVKRPLMEEFARKYGVTIEEMQRHWKCIEYLKKQQKYE